MTEETTPQRARRLAREYVGRFHEKWSSERKKWLRLAFAKGYQAACEDIADAIDAIPETLCYDDYAEDLGTILDRFDTRMAEERS